MRIGTAGWAIPRAVADRFPAEGAGLARYGRVLNAVEINSSFHRPHRAATYARWADATPGDFRFSLKAPKAVTHEARLAGADATMAAFVTASGALGDKRGPILLQFPPSFAFDAALFGGFLRRLRDLTDAPLACEPRHASWFTPEVDGWLAERRVARVAADPARHPGAGEPGGWCGLSYWRLHGSPRIYWSAYPDEALTALAGEMSRCGSARRWCVFDNTASGAAADNALALKRATGPAQGQT